MGEEEAATVRSFRGQRNSFIIVYAMSLCVKQVDVYVEASRLRLRRFSVVQVISVFESWRRRPVDCVLCSLFVRCSCERLLQFSPLQWPFTSSSDKVQLPLTEPSKTIWAKIWIRPRIGLQHL